MTDNDQPIHTTALDPTRRHHFVGIGGIGMSAIARILLARGIRVSGSDAKDSPMLARLRSLGAEVHDEHAADHVERGDVLVLSDAIRPDNPEWQRAREWLLPIIKRADLLGCLANAARGIAVSGTHGKTTTSGMLSLILLEADMDPTCILGGELAPLDGNARAGGSLTVVEACEAFNSFLDLRPEAAVVTNIEVDHLDFHGTPERLFASFRQFLTQVRQLAVVNGDDAKIREIIADLDPSPRLVTYGADEGNTYRYVDVHLGSEPTFTLLRNGHFVGEFLLRVPGMHNVSNAAGAAAMALELGAEVDAVRRALAQFPGMHRRFERLGVCGETAVVDDYAHHPTEIRATLAAARAAFPGRVAVVFQPHLFSRTRDLLEEFTRAFDAADVVLIAPIYGAREAPVNFPDVDHHLLAGRIAARLPGTPVLAPASLEDAVRILSQATAGITEGEHADSVPALKNGDVIITVGAGNVDSVAQALVRVGRTCGSEGRM